MIQPLTSELFDGYLHCLVTIARETSGLCQVYL